MELIDKLKAEGYEVRIAHHRATPAGIENTMLARKMTRNKLAMPPVQPRHTLKGGQISPRGGRTIAQIFRDGELVAEGTADCAPIDQYVRREGAMKALGRAVGALKRETAAA